MGLKRLLLVCILLLCGCAANDGRPLRRPVDPNVYRELEMQRDRADNLLRELEIKERNLESSCRAMALKIVEDEINKRPGLRELKVTGNLRPDPNYTAEENREAEQILRKLLGQIYDTHEEVTSECVEKGRRRLEQTKRKLQQARDEATDTLNNKLYPR